MSVGNDSAFAAKSYRFKLSDQSLWLDHLHRQGFVCIAKAVDDATVTQAKTELWKSIQQEWGFDTPVTDWRSLDLPAHGLCPELAQSMGAWLVRAAPGVTSAFASIWNTKEEELLTSMDCVVCWRPWGSNDALVDGGANPKQLAPIPQTEGLHLDQNPFTKPGFECVQGMVPLLPVSKRVGGLAVIPGSHSQEQQQIIRQRFPHLGTKGDWCLFPEGSFAPCQQVLVECGPGDLILWDSRTVHGGWVGTGVGDRGWRIEGGWDGGLVRMSVAVTMTERSRASETVLNQRRSGFVDGRCFNHTPHEAGSSTGTLKPRNGSISGDPPKLTSKMWRLLDGTDRPARTMVQDDLVLCKTNNGKGREVEDV